MTRSEQLHIIALNVNSMFSNQRRDTLADFLHAHKPHMLLLSETKLTPNCRVSFAGYNFVRNDRKRTSTSGRSNGGTGIVISNEFVFEHVKLPTQLFLESTVLKVKLTSNKNLFIISVYGSTTDSSQFNTDFDQLFRLLRLDDVNNMYVMAGDLNAKHRTWLNPVNNSRGNAVPGLQFQKRWTVNARRTPRMVNGRNDGQKRGVLAHFARSNGRSARPLI